MKGEVKLTDEQLDELGKPFTMKPEAKETILVQMVEEMPFKLSSRIYPYILEAMDIYAKQQTQELTSSHDEMKLKEEIAYSAKEVAEKAYQKSQQELQTLKDGLKKVISKLGECKNTENDYFIVTSSVNQLERYIS